MLSLYDIVIGGENFRRVQWAHAMPPPELHITQGFAERALRGRCHLYIFWLAVDPKAQGKGYGRALLRAALRIADARGMPAALETMTTKNMQMYSRYGFVVVGQHQVDGCEEPWYAMVREPALAGGLTLGEPHVSGLNKELL